MRRRIVAVLMVVVLGLMNFGTAFANPKADAENKKESAKEDLNSLNSQIGDIESRQAKLKDKMKGINSQLVDLLVTVDMLSEEKDNKEKDLKKVKVDLKVAKKNEKTQYEAMKLRIQYMYENGDSAFLEAVLGAKDFADLLNQVEYSDEVYSYDRKLLVTYQTTKLETQELQAKLTDEINDLADLKEQYRDEQKNLETLVAKLGSEISDFDSKLEQAKELASEYKQTIVAQNEIIKKQERAQKEQREREEEQKRQEEENNNNNNDNDSDDEDGSGSDSGKDPDYSTDVSGSQVVAYAQEFLGKPYVWGGTDPNTGVDCSGFTQYVFRHFGISIPRTASQQRSYGQEVSYSNAQPGDLIFYPGHVVLYMGNGRIIHARGAAYGICISEDATYRPILAVRRVL